jgi:hypothetical protein
MNRGAAVLLSGVWVCVNKAWATPGLLTDLHMCPCRESERDERGCPGCRREAG